MNPDLFPFPADVAVVGGGAAGLNAALILGRAGRRVVLFDDPDGRDMPDSAHQQGASPAAVRRLAQEHLAFFGVRVRAEPVLAVRGADGGFGLLGSGWVHARKLLLATGLLHDREHGHGRDRDRDRDLPPTPGLADGAAIDHTVPFVAVRARQRSPLVDDLGCALAGDGRVLVDGGGRTTVPGVSAAGEMTTTMAGSRTVAETLAADLERQKTASRVAVSYVARPRVGFPAVLGPAR